MSVKALEICRDYYRLLAPVSHKIPNRSHVIRVMNGSDSYFFKFHSLSTLSTPSTLDFLYRTASEGEFTPTILQTKTGHYLGIRGNVCFTLSHWIERSGSAAEYLPKIAARLAEFHNLLAKLGHVNLLNHIESTVGTLQSALARFHLEPLEDFLAQFQEQATSHCWQAVHNDLHEENILIENGQVFFVDLDSASWNSPWMDIASCAYRIGKGDETDMASFVEKYNRSSKTPVNPDMKTLWHFVAFRALQRIIFLLIMRENHQYEWLNDMPWQLRYLNHAIERLGRPNLMKHLDFLRYIVQM